MRNSENALKIVTAETQYLPISFKCEKDTHIYNYSKTFRIFLFEPSSKRNSVIISILGLQKLAYDSLSKKFTEDSDPITTQGNPSLLRASH